MLIENKTFQGLNKNLSKDFSLLMKIKIAVLGDSATQLYVKALKGYGFEVGLNFDVFEADYDQIERQVFDYSSELYKFAPEYVIIFYCSNKLLKKFGELNTSDKSKFSSECTSQFENLFQSLSSNLNSKVIFFNFQEINDSVFGNYSNKISSSFIYQLRIINLELMNIAQRIKNFFVLDINLLQGQYGKKYLEDNKIYLTTGLLLSIDFLPVAVKHTTDIIRAIGGNFTKCVILDLDNTLWGGIIGDDGIENIQIGDLGIGKVFCEIQRWVKELKKRGIILAICSKNNEVVAKEPFEKHPDMVLRLDDIAVFVANWNNKADNIRYIQEVLNIGFDSIVFIDDNPFERNLVRSNIPEIIVPELPEDPAEYLDYLRSLNLFETASFTEEDEQRTLQYQEEANRVVIQHQFTNENDFLINLGMVSHIECFNNFNTPRVSQLTQRSNQFNLRTVRYTEEEIRKISTDDNYMTIAFSLTDKFGDYGLISLIILKKNENKSLFIDTWIMSCRVLKRSMEAFVLNTIVDTAKVNHFEIVVGEYLPTLKNNMVKTHYKDLGFKTIGTVWELNVSEYIEKECFVNRKQIYG